MRSRTLFTLLTLVLTTASCARTTFESSSINGNSSTGAGSNDNGGTDTPPVVNPPDTNHKFTPLAWEATVSGSKAWSDWIYKVISEEFPEMLGQNVASDVETFCPKYRSLNDNERMNFWGQLLAGMAKFESGWKPTTYYVETTMGTDPITGRQIASEGLLQLSYQDENNYKFECGFDWSKDKNYSNTDARKTILSPYNNLRCGIMILSRQLTRKGAIALSSGPYWSVIKLGGTYNKISEISAITKSLPFCK